MQERLNILLEKHCETIKGSVTALGRLLADLSAGTSSDPLAEVEAAEALAHQLKGSSGTAGFQDISRAATALDDYLKLLCREGPAGVANGIVEAMSLYRTLERIADNTTPNSSRLYHAA
jgi:HPt (histidine-containing phosphotransfer) domain-containing protein